MESQKLQFEWDNWNYYKNEIKHGISCIEAESAFSDSKQSVFPDIKHSSSKETRYVLYGKSEKARVLMIGFTVRMEKVRIITARPASRKERKIYEEDF